MLGGELVLNKSVCAQTITKLATPSGEIELQQLRHNALTTSGLSSLFPSIVTHKICSPGPVDMQRMPYT